VLTLLVGIGAVSAHEHREVGEYSIEVGFLEEPVYTGDKSGLELFVAHHESEEPVEGLEETLSAEVTFGDETRELELEVGGDTARVTTIPTSGTIPQVTTLETEAGMLRLAVSGTPVFVELEP
jgi:hypothetical protein